MFNKLWTNRVILMKLLSINVNNLNRMGIPQLVWIIVRFHYTLYALT